MKNISKITILFLVLFGMAACGDDYLDRPPLLEESRELVLADFDGMNGATVGLYAELYHASWYGAQFPIVADLKGDNGKRGPLSSGRYIQFYNWNQDPSQTQAGLWFRAYRLITSASNIINAAPNVELFPGQQQAWVDHLVAEAKFMRALGHFDLVRVFAQPYTHDPSSLGVPVITVTRIGSPERDPVSDVYAQIVQDLQDAIDLFDPNFAFNTHRAGAQNLKGFTSANAAKALLARVYLYMGDNTNAAAMATQVIDSGNYTLYDESNFLDVWGTDAASEIIFEVFGSTGNSNWPSWEEIGYIFDPSGSYGDVCATNSLMNLFHDDDIRKQLFIEPANHPGYFWPAKYPGKDGNTRQNNIPVLRLSEMYLIRAEANQSVDDINAIRTRRGIDPLGAFDMDELFDERRRELNFEGHLLFDYARLGRSLEREDEENQISGILNVGFPSHLWAMPIPIGEMEANPNMVQNPGY